MVLCCLAVAKGRPDDTSDIDGLGLPKPGLFQLRLHALQGKRVASTTITTEINTPSISKQTYVQYNRIHTHSLMVRKSKRFLLYTESSSQPRITSYVTFCAE